MPPNIIKAHNKMLVDFTLQPEEDFLLSSGRLVLNPTRENITGLWWGDLNEVLIAGLLPNLQQVVFTGCTRLLPTNLEWIGWIL